LDEVRRLSLLRLMSPRHAEPATAGWRQIAKASSSNATAIGSFTSNRRPLPEDLNAIGDAQD
jgi:hypothetical protein